MSDIEDPEVIADLKLRAATEHDRLRSREMPAFVPSPVIDRVPCRNRCGAVVGWTEQAEETFQTFNRELARKMEPQLDKTRIVFCNTCRMAGGALSADRNRKQVDFVAQVIRELKSGLNGEKYQEAIQKLRKAGHPDVEGLEQTLRDKEAAKPSKKFTRGSL
jgi:hypothetical protein